HSHLNWADVKRANETHKGRYTRQAVRGGGARVRGTGYRRRQHRGDRGGGRLHARGVLFELQEQGRADHRHARGSRRAIHRAHPRSAREAQEPCGFHRCAEDHEPQPAGSARPLSPAAHGMILFVARAEKRRPELAKRLRARKKLVTDIIETTARNSGRTTILNPTWAGALV